MASGERNRTLAREMATSTSESVHDHLSRAASILKGCGSTLRNAVSSHKLKNPISFQALDTFCLNATKQGGCTASQLYLESLDGEPVISARLCADPEPAVAQKSKKRGRDDAAERAEAACSKLKRISTTSKSQVALAQKTIEQLLRSIRGPRGEEVFEACGVSLAPVKSVNASANSTPSAERPKMIVACRLSAGVPIALKPLRAALGECFRDGMITTAPGTLGPEYQLPLSDTGRAIEGQGQRSMLLFAAVPDTPADAKESTKM